MKAIQEPIDIPLVLHGVLRISDENLLFSIML